MTKGKSTLESAQAKWEQNTIGKGSEWCAGVAAFLGVQQCNPAIERAFTSGVKGKGSKWAANYRRKMSGGA